MKILTVVGARPQFIKAAAVSRALRDRPQVREVLVHTGQHYDVDMSDIFFESMDIPRPAHSLGISGGGHGAMTGRMMEALENVVEMEAPDWVLVYGDTNSTLAGALVAAKLHRRVAHVEAGLRSYNMRMPEEINRVITDRVSALLLCPTEQAVRNLLAEGYQTLGPRIERIGDVMLDAALFYRERASRPVGFTLKSSGEPFAVATVHRAENTDDPVRLRNILTALNELNTRIPVVLPLHPRARARLQAQGLKAQFTILDPVGYLEMVWLLENCCLVLTDSGGLQKEAWFFHRPCVTLRDETEWVELLEAGGTRLAGADPARIRAATQAALESTPDYDRDYYGAGDAAARAVRALVG